MQRQAVRRIIAYHLLLIIFNPLLLSCAILPRSGPTKHDVYGSSYGHIPIISVTLNVSRITNTPTLYPWILPSKNAFINYELLDVGDKLDINIWENASEGLYTDDKKGAAHLGPTIISGAGTIYIPYVGKVTAAGKTIDQLQHKLTMILKNKVMNPQITVNKIEGFSKRISIQGVVSKPGTFEITPGRHDLISMLAEAGGSTFAPELTEIILERRGRKFKTTLANIFQSRHYNINLHPHDNIVISEINRTFSVLGATGMQKLIKFPKGELSLIEAVALAGGLSDELANPSSVFVLRYESANIVNLLAPSCRRNLFEGKAQIIYELNMKQMQSVFAAQQFKVKDGDLIITTDAPYTNARKILSSLSPAVGAGNTIAVNTLAG